MSESPLSEVRAGEVLFSCRNLSIRHEDAERPSPAGVSLTIRRGEAVLVLGPSGCGKSTLALAAAALIPGAVPAGLSGDIVERTERIAIVFQDADAQIVTGSVFDEVAFGMENLLWPTERIERRARWALQRVGLWEKRAQAPELLSGGERQRLAIAAAIASDPPLLVLDEPTANLDPAARSEVYGLLAELMADGERGLLLIEHSLDDAMRIATRLVVLNERGTVIADGPPRRLIAERGDEFERIGVWLPVASLAARRLRDAGWPVEGTPLTGRELTAAIDAIPPDAGARPALANTREPAPRPGQTTPSTAEPALEARGITVQRRGRSIIEGLSLSVPRGSFTALVGPNGAGKSTLLLALAGLEPPISGSVLARGAELSRMPAHELRAETSFVFQNPEHQFIRRTVRDELEVELHATGVAEQERRERVDAHLRRFGLLEHAERHPFLLSGGQKRRLSVSTALIASAGTLLLDEPTFGQDRGQAEELVGMLRDLHADGTTIVMATHDLQLVIEHATHITVMAEGQIVQTGTAAEVLASGALEAAGLGLPPLAEALARVRSFPQLGGVTRLRDLAGFPWPPEPQAPARRVPAGSASSRPPAPGPVHEAGLERARLDRPTVAQAKEMGLPWLHRRHPLAKMAVPFAVIMALFFTRDIATPAACTLLAQIAVLSGMRFRLAPWLAVAAGPWLIAGLLSCTLGAWVDVREVSDTPVLLQVGAWTFHEGAWFMGLASGMRLMAITMLAFLAGAATAGSDFIRMLVQHLRVPYRFGYAALAAFRFVPRFRIELASIERAHRARGTGWGRGPTAWLRRTSSALVPLIAGALLHAERVALSMEARSFGYAATRTERHPLSWGRWDTLLVLASAIAALGAFALPVLAPALP